MGRSILNQNDDRAVIMDQAIKYFEQIISQNDSQNSTVSGRDSKSQDMTTSSQTVDITFENSQNQTKVVERNTRLTRRSTQSESS